MKSTHQRMHRKDQVDNNWTRLIDNPARYATLWNNLIKKMHVAVLHKFLLDNPLILVTIDRQDSAIHLSSVFLSRPDEQLPYTPSFRHFFLHTCVHPSKRCQYNVSTPTRCLHANLSLYLTDDTQCIRYALRIKREERERERDKERTDLTAHYGEACNTTTSPL